MEGNKKKIVAPPARWASRLWPCCALLLALACALPAQAALMTKLLGRSIVYVSGELKPGEDKEFAAMLDDQVRQVYISSPGGDAAVAAAMGRMVRQRRLGVRVVNQCLKACAQYIFMAGTGNTIVSDALVGLQAGDVPLLRLTVMDLRSTTPLNEQETTWIRALLDKYTLALGEQGGAKLAFEQEMGLNTELIARMEAVTAPRDVDVVGVTDKGMLVKARTPACELWVPDREGWKKLGVNVAPFTRPDAASVAKRVNTEAARVALLTPAPTDGEAVWCDNQRAPMERELFYQATLSPPEILPVADKP